VGPRESGRPGRSGGVGGLDVGKGSGVFAILRYVVDLVAQGRGQHDARSHLPPGREHGQVPQPPTRYTVTTTSPSGLLDR